MRKILLLITSAVLAACLAACSNGNEDSAADLEFDSEALEAKLQAEGAEGEAQEVERDMDFEVGVGLPTFDDLFEYFKNVAGMTLEENKDGSITVYGHRTGDEIGEIIYGDDGDDYDMMLIIDKKAGDKEEGDAVYCLRNALVSVLRAFNGYDMEDPFDDAMDIIEYGTQSAYLYGMQEYLVGNVDGGASYAIKVTNIS